MPTWNNLEDRKVAATAFAAELASDAALREKCQASSEVARETFAKIGAMDDIPADTEFRVFGESDPARDRLVVIVIPDSSSSEETPAFEVLRCTRPPG